MKINKIYSIFLIMVSLIMFNSCSDNELSVNLFDPNLDDYELPETTIDSSPDPIGTSSSVAFTFSGNDLVTEYSFRLIFAGGEIVVNWTPWSSVGYAQFLNLEDGQYIFYVKGRYSDGVEDESPASNTFTINSLPETVIDSSPESYHTSSSAVFAYSGNALVQDYSYKLQREELGEQAEISTVIVDWTSWSSESSAQIDYLDEGYYTFFVKGRYSNGAEDPTPASATFTVDAVGSSSLRVFPLLSSASVDDVFEVDIYAEDISSVSMIELQIEYDDTQITVYNDSIIRGDLLESFEGDLNIFIEQQSSNTILITIGVGASDFGNGLGGTGSICNIQFFGQNPGSSSINIVSSEFRDKDNNSISIVEVVNGGVQID